MHDDDKTPSQGEFVGWLNDCAADILTFVQTGEYPVDPPRKAEPPKRSARILRSRKGGVRKIIQPVDFRDRQARYEARVLPSGRAYECAEDRDWAHAHCAANEAQLALYAETAQTIYRTVMQHLRFRIATLSGEERKLIQRRVKAVIRRELAKRINR